MKIDQILEYRDMCNVCGQTPCNCTHVIEGADERKQNALWAQITAHEKAAKKSKDLKQQHHLKMADQLRSQLKTSDLNEFAPGSGDDREPNEEEILRQLAAQWWSGTEQQMARAQQALEAMGWEIGPDESGDEDAGVYVYRIGDDDGKYTIAFGHSELSLNEAVAEGAGNVGNAIKSLYQKIYAAGDDEIEYFYQDSPIFAQYWDEYEGDLDSIIAEVDPSELQVILDELESYVQNANLAEGWTKLPSGDYINQHTGVRSSKPPVKKKRGEKTGAEWDAIEKAKKDKEPGVAEGLNEFAPNDDGGEDRDHEYEVYQCNPDDQFDWIGGPIYKTDDMGKAHDIAYKLNKKYPNKAFMIWQERSQGSRGGYGIKDDEQGVAEGDKKPEPPEADYGPDYQDMVARVKKLAGLGPLKTVYDPQKRVYKNVPTAVQPKK